MLTTIASAAITTGPAVAPVGFIVEVVLFVLVIGSLLMFLRHSA